MIELQVEFLDSDLRALLTVLHDLPDLLRPVSYGSEESVVEGQVSSRSFERFVVSNPFGFFMLAPAVRYSIRVDRKSRVICEGELIDMPESASLPQAFLRAMAVAEPIFGFACAPAERISKNRIVVTTSQGALEAWVGRDVTRYVPGLYWLTLMSRRIIDAHSVSEDALRANAIDVENLPKSTRLFQFFREPESWNSDSVAQRLQPLVRNATGIFNADAVRRGMPQSQEFFDVSSYLATWK